MRDFVKGFISRQGNWVLGAHVFSKVMGFLTVLYVVRTHSEADYGLVSYALVVVNALVPFMGLGAFQAFLRFGSDRPGYWSKKQLYRYAYGRGMVASAGLAAVVLAAAPIICGDLPGAVPFMRILAFSLLSVLLMEYAKSYARLMGMNRQAGQIEIAFAVCLLALTVMLTYFLGMQGYALAMVMAPLAAAVPYIVVFRLPGFSWGRETDSGAFWRYGIFVTLGALTGQLFYAVDVYMIGHLIPDAARDIALYRVSAIIPLAGLVVPIAVASADFVKNSENKSNPQALRTYMRGYLRTFIPLTLVLTLVLLWVTPVLLSLFGSQYSQNPALMRIFVLGMAGAYLLRVPFGNLLSAVGRADWNTYHNILIVILAIGLCALVVPAHGILGAAWVTAGLMWLSGVFSAMLLLLHLKKISAT